MAAQALSRCGDCSRLLLEEEEPLGYCGTCVEDEDQDDPNQKEEAR